MSPPRPARAVLSAVALALGAGASGSSLAQTSPSGANLSTGSGAGTSPGVSPGSSPSSTRAGTNTLTRPEMPQSGAQVRPPDSRRGGFNPATGLPFAMEGLPAADLSAEEMERIDAQLLDNMRAIRNPPDRALAMQRVAYSKIYAHVPGDDRLEEARLALIEGGEAALLVADITTRDIRLTSLVRTGIALADEQVREALTDATEVFSTRDQPWTARRRLDMLLLAEKQREASAALALRIHNPSLRSEMLFRVVDGQAQGSANLAQQALLADDRRSDLKGQESMLNRMADRALVLAGNDAGRIDMAIWRDRAMVSIAAAAASSEQYERGIELSRTIPQPEYRSDALIRLAESLARRDRTDAATTTYAEAASAVASIPIADPRATLASVLIDSLIAVGRFDDARACVPFYPDAVRRLNALGTIAESQGERRLSASAFAWIDREAPPEIRDNLRLRVNEGVLRAYENSRSQKSTMGDFLDPPADPGAPPSTTPPAPTPEP